MRCSVCWRSAVLALSSSEDLCSSTAWSAASPNSPASASGLVPTWYAPFITGSKQPDSWIEHSPRSSFGKQGILWRVHCYGQGPSRDTRSPNEETCLATSQAAGSEKLHVIPQEQNAMFRD